MPTYRVTANLTGNTDDKFKADIEADNEDQAWAIAYKSQLPRGIYNGKVEELPTRAELLARIQELETAAKVKSLGMKPSNHNHVFIGGTCAHCGIGVSEIKTA